MSAPWRQVHKTFWSDPKVVDFFTPEDKFFYLYLLTNEHTTQCGVYKISLKQIGFETGYSIETVKNLVERFQSGLKRIKYNTETNEIAILNWAKYNYPTTVKDNRFLCIQEEISTIKDVSLIDEVLLYATPEIRDALSPKQCQPTTSPGVHDYQPSTDSDLPNELTSPSQAPSDPLRSPLQAPPKPLPTPFEAPYKPLGEEKEEEKEQEKREEPRAREVFSQQKPTYKQAEQLAARWFGRFNTLTGLKTIPDTKAIELSRRLLAFLGNDLDMAYLAVDYYFSNWRELWFACERNSRTDSVDKRKWEFRFSSFTDPENFQEILSRLTRQTEAKSWTTAVPLVDNEPEDPEKKEKALQRMREFLKYKHFAVTA